MSDTDNTLPTNPTNDVAIGGDLSVGGDTSVSHNMEVGGRMAVRGHETVDHNLIVKGWLRAKNIICHFRGFYLSLDDAPTDGHSGDYIFVKDEEPATTVSIWVWDVDNNEWIDSGVDTTFPTEIDIDESDVHLMAYFESGQVLAETSIIDNLTTNSADDVLSAKQGKVIWDRIVPVVATLGVNVTNPQKYTGSNVPVTLTWTCKRDGANKIPTQVVIKKDGTTIETISNPQSHTGEYTTTFNYLNASTLIGNTVFSVEITADGLTATANQTITQYLPCYVGFYASGSSANTMKSSFTEKVINGVSALSGTYTNDASTKYLTLLVPNNFTITKVTSSGFDVPMQTVSTDNSIEVPSGTARTYKVYRSASLINAGNMSIVVQ